MYPGVFTRRLKNICLTAEEFARLEEVENAACVPTEKGHPVPWLRLFFDKHYRQLKFHTYFHLNDGNRCYIRGLIAADTAQPVKHAYRVASGVHGLELREIRNARVSTYGPTGDQYLYTPQGELLRLGNGFGGGSYTTVGPTKYDRVEAIQGSQVVRKWVEERQAKVKNQMTELQGYLDNYARVLRRLEPATDGEHRPGAGRGPKPQCVEHSGEGGPNHGGQP